MIRFSANIYAIKISVCLFLFASFFQISYSQSSYSRVHYAGKNVFLSGINIAWVNFAADLGPAPPDLSKFRTVFQTVRNNGGNALRLWLNTNGRNTPTYNSNGYVTGPGAVAIQNLKQILALAHHYDVGLILCLWSFDMLHRAEFIGADSVILRYNYKLLTDTSYTMAYIRNALVPMIDSVKDDPAIIAWEVCNEPNGMATGMSYYPADPTVPMSAIQRFTNLIAGAIHRADPGALVTIGAGSFQTLTDVNLSLSMRKSQLKSVSSLSAGELQDITRQFNIAHRLNLTTQQMLEYLQKVAVLPDSNYYRDDRLINAGGDSSGVLDFYSVHYYSSGSTMLSPFSHPFSYWGLKKPTVVAEFYMQTTDGIPDYELFPILYQNGYAGALVWSWTDFPDTPYNPSNADADTWAALQTMRRNFRQDVDVFAADWPTILITSPRDNSSFADSSHLTLLAAVTDSGSSIASVRFFVADSMIGEVDTASYIFSDTLYYSFVWRKIIPGAYTISAIATNSKGQEEISNPVKVYVGRPRMTRLEAEKAAISGGGISIKANPTASGGYFLDITTNDTTSKVTWRFNNIGTAGSYPISFGYELEYDTPKIQFINVNGVRVDTVVFDGPMKSWLEKTITVNLVQGENSVQMQVWWGWMYLDYLAVPTNILTSVTSSRAIPITFSSFQNYPNPFNSSTKIRFYLPSTEEVTLTVYNVLGQRVETLINQKLTEGDYTVNFDGSKLTSGLYFYQLKAGSHVETRKMILLK